MVSAFPFSNMPPAVSSMSPGEEGETQAALPTRSITSQPMSPVRVFPAGMVTTAKLLTVPAEPPPFPSFPSM